MDPISKSRKLGLAIFLIPILTINSLLILSQSFEFKNKPTPGNYYKDIKIYDAGKALGDKQGLKSNGFKIPYIDGTTSISRLSRVFPNWLVFKPLMILTGILLYLFWKNQKKILSNLKIDKKIVNKIYFFGLMFSITLIIHVLFLGIKYDNDLYKFLKQLNLLCSVLFAISTKFYFVKCVKEISEINSNLKNIFFKIQNFLVNLLLIILLLCFFLILIEKPKTFNLIVEWNYFFLTFLFYFLYYLSWRKVTI